MINSILGPSGRQVIREEKQINFQNFDRVKAMNIAINAARRPPMLEVIVRASSLLLLRDQLVQIPRYISFASGLGFTSLMVVLASRTTAKWSWMINQEGDEVKFSWRDSTYCLRSFEIGRFEANNRAVKLISIFN